jgi:hypothetical protein
VIERDRAGATIEDPDLLKVSKRIYRYGKALEKVGKKGLKGKPYQALKKLKRVFEILDTF